MMRVENWDSRLVEQAQAMVGESFRWGSTDCVTVTRRCLVAILGVDPWAEVPTYKSKRAALATSGATSAEDALRATGAYEVGHHSGTAGDVALGPELDAHGMPAVSMLLPTRKALVSTVEFGVVIVDKLALPEATRFFRYG